MAMAKLWDLRAEFIHDDPRAPKILEHAANAVV